MAEDDPVEWVIRYSCLFLMFLAFGFFLLTAFTSSVPFDIITIFRFIIVIGILLISGLELTLGLVDIPWLQPIDKQTGWREGIKPGSNDRYVIGFVVVTILLVVLAGIVMFTNELGTKSVALWEGGTPHILVFVLALPFIPAVLFVIYNVYIRIGNAN